MLAHMLAHFNTKKKQPNEIWLLFVIPLGLEPMVVIPLGFK
jgi:hypothetical protein